ncbi:MAG: penicillin-binding protein 2 [Lachnospiraceae bacterium]|nr:penicillin-binding protein 2 [Lachnospiraceae bacterium]
MKSGEDRRNSRSRSSGRNAKNTRSKNSRSRSDSKGRRRNNRDKRRDIDAENGENIRKNKRANPYIIMVTYAFVLLFLGMIAYLSYFMIFQSKEKINNPYNTRYTILNKRIIKGSIKSADGKRLAYTKEDMDGNIERIYPYKNMYAHVVGREKNTMTGIEKAYCYPLLTSDINPLTKLVNDFKGVKNPGDNVITTLNHKLQKVAYEALGNNRGAVVAIEPSTGKILAMVSKPDYDPNTVDKNWDSLVKADDDSSALLNRATQGQYPPGSTFKVLTAIEYLIENSSTYAEYNYNCKGTANFGEDADMKCYGSEVHGNVNLAKSLAESCNCSFANIGLNIDMDRLVTLAERFGFNKGLMADYEYKSSKISVTSKSSTAEKIETAIGQGKTLVTPLQNAMVAATIANKGVMMKPYLVDSIVNDNGTVVKQYKEKKNGKVISESVSEEIGQYMCQVTDYGTARSLSSLPYKVAGKTGTAEYDSKGSSHAWFIGYAPYKNPKIAISIVVESSGTGSQYAVPIAQSMFSAYIN